MLNLIQMKPRVCYLCYIFVACMFLGLHVLCVCVCIGYTQPLFTLCPIMFTAQ